MKEKLVGIITDKIEPRKGIKFKKRKIPKSIAKSQFINFKTIKVKTPVKILVKDFNKK